MTQQEVIQVDGSKAVLTSMLFIDGTNFDRWCDASFFRLDVSYEKLVQSLSSGTDLKKIYYATATYRHGSNDPLFKAQSATLNALRKMPLAQVDLQQYRKRTERCPKCRRDVEWMREKGTDTAVASNFIEAAVLRAADELILLANDSDYGPVFEVARRHGQKCVLAYVAGGDRSSFNPKMSLPKIVNNASRIIRIDDAFMYNCWLA